MRGFSDSRQPVFIRLGTGIPALDDTEHRINGERAEATDNGLIFNIADMRYFLPWHNIVYIRQEQVPLPEPPDPVATPRIRNLPRIG